VHIKGTHTHTTHWDYREAHTCPQKHTSQDYTSTQLHP